ncbi:Uncharacterized protein TPAR_00804 [Tolypocladium paradoxum]|uniref:Uncharacterized protein n=1 Tax=Tolypocladium paradoxum TaxID=94208 RepID=A0A2S4L968_9HYPO|nr:Uncharacterized protein TPAR_00804 [Tolypocladium paradoxum]
MSSSSTPARKPSAAAQKKQQQQQQQRQRYAADDDDEDEFTPEMRDRQARGKDPYKDDGSDFDDFDEDEDEVGSDGVVRRRMRVGQGAALHDWKRTGERANADGRTSLKTESFEDRERRGFALSVLDNPEQLMMYAQSTSDSIPSQRRRFSAMLAGFEPLPSAAAEGSAGKKPPGARRGKAKRPPEARGEWVD